MAEVATKSEALADRMLMCTICGWLYHEARGVAGAIAAGTPWTQVPSSFVCPECAAGTEWFQEFRIGGNGC